VLSALGDGANVRLSPAWLSTEPSSSFPLDIDPTITYEHTVTSVDNSGRLDSFCFSGAPEDYNSYPYQCPVTVGNNGSEWTTMDNFTYPIYTSASPSDWNMSWPWNPVVTNATVELSGTTNPGGTTPSGNGYINIYQSTAAFSFPDIKNYPSSLTSPLGSATQYSGGTYDAVADAAPVMSGTSLVEWSGCSNVPSPQTTMVEWEQAAMCNWSSPSDSCYTNWGTSYGCGG
jgi:hypothetical protein